MNLLPLIKSSQSMLHSSTIAVSCESHTRHRNTPVTLTTHLLPVQTLRISGALHPLTLMPSPLPVPCFTWSWTPPTSDTSKTIYRTTKILILWDLQDFRQSTLKTTADSGVTTGGLVTAYEARSSRIPEDTRLGEFRIFPNMEIIYGAKLNKILCSVRWGSHGVDNGL